MIDLTKTPTMPRRGSQSFPNELFTGSATTPLVEVVTWHTSELGSGTYSSVELRRNCGGS